MSFSINDLNQDLKSDSNLQALAQSFISNEENAESYYNQQTASELSNSNGGSSGSSTPSASSTASAASSTVGSSSASDISSGTSSDAQYTHYMLNATSTVGAHL